MLSESAPDKADGYCFCFIMDTIFWGVREGSRSYGLNTLRF